MDIFRRLRRLASPTRLQAASSPSSVVSRQRLLQFQNPRHFQLLVDFFRKDMDATDAPLYSHQTRIATPSAGRFFLGATCAASRDDPPSKL